MVHPHTELRFIDPVMGYGVFATRPIPRGTITWARDGLDQVFTTREVSRLSPLERRALDHYSFVDRLGHHILCWDHARYMNHACEANCLSPGYAIEIAVRDIAAGEQLTDDYGTLNLEGLFECRCGSPVCRKWIKPDDLMTYGERWDAVVADNFVHIPRVEQPLWEVVMEKEAIERALDGREPIVSCMTHYHAPRRVRRVAAAGT